jgi:hypothetical protein
MSQFLFAYNCISKYTNAIQTIDTAFQIKKFLCFYLKISRSNKELF